MSEGKLPKKGKGKQNRSRAEQKLADLKKRKAQEGEGEGGGGKLLVKKLVIPMVFDSFLPHELTESQDYSFMDLIYTTKVERPGDCFRKTL